MLEELSSGYLGKLFPKQLTTLWLWQRERWECQRLVPFVTQIPFRCFSCCLCSCICKLNRKDLATREANSTESSRISWSRVETSPEETELEVRWPPSPAEWHSHQDTRFVSARKKTCGWLLKSVLSWTFNVFRVLPAVPAVQIGRKKKFYFYLFFLFQHNSRDFQSSPE